MKLKAIDYVILLIIIMLGVLPDPSDAFDFGLPLVEGIIGVVYYRWRSKK